MDFNRVFRHGAEGIHVCGERFNVHFDFFGRFFCVLNRIGRDHRDGVADLEDFLIAEDGAIPAVAFVVREGNQT